MSLDYKLLDDDELIALIRLDMGKDELEKALVKTKYLNAKKENMEGLSLTAKIFAQLGLFEKAKSSYKNYLKKEEGSITERFQYGMVLFDNGNSIEAFKEWEKVLEIEPAHPPTLFYKGLSLANESKIVEAQQSLTILLQSAPSDNLYFGRAKKLLDTLNNNSTKDDSTNIANATIPDAYKSIN